MMKSISCESIADHRLSALMNAQTRMYERLTFPVQRWKSRVAVVAAIDHPHTFVDPSIIGMMFAVLIYCTGRFLINFSQFYKFNMPVPLIKYNSFYFHPLRKKIPSMFRELKELEKGRQKEIKHEHDKLCARKIEQRSPRVHRSISSERHIKETHCLA